MKISTAISIVRFVAVLFSTTTVLADAWLQDGDTNVRPKSAQAEYYTTALLPIGNVRPALACSAHSPSFFRPM